MTPDIDALLRWASWLLTLPVVLFSRARRSSPAPGATCARAASAWTCRWRSASRSTFVASTRRGVRPGGVFGREVYFDSLTMFVVFLLGGPLPRAARARTAPPARSKR